MAYSRLHLRLLLVARHDSHTSTNLAANRPYHLRAHLASGGDLLADQILIEHTPTVDGTLVSTDFGNVAVKHLSRGEEQSAKSTIGGRSGCTLNGWCQAPHDGGGELPSVAKDDDVEFVVVVGTEEGGLADIARGVDGGFLAVAGAIVVAVVAAVLDLLYDFGLEHNFGIRWMFG